MGCKNKKFINENNLNQYGKMFNNSKKLLKEFCNIINHVLNEQEKYTKLKIDLLYKPNYKDKNLNLDLILNNYENYTYLEYVENYIYYSLKTFKSSIVDKMSKSKFSKKFLMHTLGNDFENLEFSQINDIYRFNNNQNLHINYETNIICRESLDLSKLIFTKLEYEKIITAYIIMMVATSIEKEHYVDTKETHILYISSSIVQEKNIEYNYNNIFNYNNIDMITIAKKLIHGEKIKHKELQKFIDLYNYDEINKILKLLNSNFIIEKKFGIYIIKNT